MNTRAFMILLRPARCTRKLLFLLFCLPLSALPLGAQKLTAALLFANSTFDRWAAQGPATQIPWKVHMYSPGLSLHQRLVARVEMEIKGREVVKRAKDGRLIALLRVTDASGRQYRNFSVIDLEEIKPAMRKQTWISIWDAFALPGEYNVEVAVYDKASGEHSFQQSTLRVDGLNSDPLPDAWKEVPAWEFWAPAGDERDAFYRPDIEGRLHLPLQTSRPVDFEILVDLTPSDLFHGSMRFYTRYLSVVLPLMKTLSQVSPSSGSTSLATLDLRQKKVTFEQDGLQQLDWTQLKSVISPQNGPGMIDLKRLEQKHETPDFLREELLRRLRTVPANGTGSAPLRVFVVIGSPMDFYAFHQFPPIDAEQAENTQIYYLQFETYGGYADGALGKVRSMLKPLPVHTIRVRSAESVRHALARIMEEVPRM